MCEFRLEHDLLLDNLLDYHCSVYSAALRFTMDPLYTKIFSFVLRLNDECATNKTINTWDQGQEVATTTS